MALIGAALETTITDTCGLADVAVSSAAYSQTIDDPVGIVDDTVEVHRAAVYAAGPVGVAGAARPVRVLARGPPERRSPRDPRPARVAVPV